jgi:hypothetical protein
MMMRAVKISEASAVALALAFQNALMAHDVTYEIVGGG